MPSDVDVTDLSECLSNPAEWMQHLPEYALNKPISFLAIPGSHDSGAYWLDPDTPLSPGMFFNVLKMHQFLTEIFLYP